MNVRDLRILLEQLDDDAEVVVLREGKGQCFMPEGRITDLERCYFGGEQPDKDTGKCLLLSVY